MPRTKLLLTALIVVGGVVDAATSRACTAPRQGIQSRWSVPAQGATGVPTNTRAVVFYAAREPLKNTIDTTMPEVGLGADLLLRRRDGGESVAITSTRLAAGHSSYQPQVAFVLQPRDPLAPSTVYEVLDRRAKLPCGPSYPMEPCDAGELTVIAAFTTGESTDVTPPSAPAGATLKHEGLSRCTTNGCCGSYVAQHYTAHWDAPEGSGSVLYQLYSGDPASPRLLMDNFVPFALSCGGFGGDPSRLAVPPGDVQVRAVDWAGNESPAVRAGAIHGRACDNAGGGCSAGGSPAGGWWVMLVASFGVVLRVSGGRARR